MKIKVKYQMEIITDFNCFNMVLLPDSPAPKSNNFTSRHWRSKSAFKFLSIALERALASLSGLPKVQPMMVDF